MSTFNGLGMNIGNLSLLSNAESRSISSENRSGEKGKGGMALATPDGPSRDLGTGWKCHAKDLIEPGETFVMANIKGSGAIQSIWLTGTIGRDLILRIYWDGQDTPSVECPVSDFFACPWMDSRKDPNTSEHNPRINSIPVAVNPKNGMNCFWEMPFRKHCRITMENLHPTENAGLYFQINYTLTEVSEAATYFHARFNRVNPLPYKEVYTIVDDIKGQGHYVGTSMGWGINNNKWWGEGEIKFFLDGDNEFPTICGTGTEDYFGGSYNWDVDQQYQTYSTAYLGMHQLIKPDGCYQANLRHSMYRWHVMDPIRFKKDLKVTIQALGWRDGGRFLPGMHDICSVAYWYQTIPATPFPKFPDRDLLEII
jgi:D-arabinan exo alpha-(1,3)/(1,5)-arabinofuranosidase (non-reducing end)